MRKLGTGIITKAISPYQTKELFLSIIVFSFSMLDYLYQTRGIEQW